MLNELARLKKEYPDRVLIASIMEEYNKEAWAEIIGRSVPMVTWGAWHAA